MGRVNGRISNRAEIRTGEPRFYGEILYLFEQVRRGSMGKIGSNIVVQSWLFEFRPFISE